MPAITIYSTPICPYCVRAKDLLKRKGQSWQEVDVSDDAARAAMIAKAGGRRTVPQIFIGEMHVGDRVGCPHVRAGWFKPRKEGVAAMAQRVDLVSGPDQSVFEVVAT